MSYLQYQTRKITAKRQPQSHDNQKYKEGIILNSAALLKLDIVWGTEPWLNGIKPWTNPVTDAMKSSEIFLWNYYVYRNDRGTPEVEAFVMEKRSILSIEQTHFVTEWEIKIKLKSYQELLIWLCYMPQRKQYYLDQLNLSSEKKSNLITTSFKSKTSIYPNENWDTTTASNPDKEIKQGLVNLTTSNNLTQMYI